MEITAAIVEGEGGPFKLQPVLLEGPGAGEILVRVEAAGLCHTDLSVVSGATPFPLPAILGHEGIGIVDCLGAGVTGFAEGDRVILSFTWCGECRACLRGKPVYCDHWIRLNLLGGARLDGSSAYSRDTGPVHGHFFGQSSFASHTVVKARAAVKVSNELPVTQLAPLGCSVQTGVGAVLNVARPEPGSSVAVFGVGGVGLAAVMGAALTAATQVIAVDVNGARLALARQLGATHTVDAADSDPVEAIADLTHGGALYTIETSGRLPVLGQAINSLASSGRCVVIGAPPLGSEIPIDVPNLLGRGIRLIGTNQGDSVPSRILPQLIDLIRSGKLPLERLTRTYPFAEINEAAEAARSGQAIKPVLVMP